MPALNCFSKTKKKSYLKIIIIICHRIQRCLNKAQFLYFWESSFIGERKYRTWVEAWFFSKCLFFLIHTLKTCTDKAVFD